ncbi:MAG: Eco57I restriction-modification methylase domain-containing protein, partial [Bacteroidales bacterium]|nr:Eco57I restriction-modification methylase domain-containing protein [Bacteroidales bacterium]
MDYKPIIESAYNRKNWQELLHDIFGRRITFFATPTRIDDVNNNTAKHALYLGKIDLADGKTIAVYEVPLAESVVVERNKVNIRNLLVSHWRNSGFAGAFMFCFKENEAVLRFSYVSEIMAFKEDGKLGTEATDTKRYTYILGEGRGCRTAIEQFSKLKESAQNLSDVTEAFSVETLTKQFYKDLFEWYQWAVDDSSNISFPNNTTTEADDREDIEKKVIRMITRIMFVWFIKQKDLVPHKIFDPKFLKTVLKDFDPNSRTNGNFYNAILQNLFFATLNRAIVDEDGNKRKFATSTKRDIKTLYRYADMFKISEEQVVDLFSDVPFLNGGLFECLDKTRYIDGVEVAYNYDGFSRNDHTFADGRFKHRAVVPNNLFFEQEKGLLSILNRYNFTIEENTPEEQQVALDPELLGKVFENLLGAYNPETKETARNQSGSFYTPREIVNYMVDESLIAFLGDTPFVRSLFSSDFTYDVKQKTEYKKVAEKLKSVKVLDPACGSGAFPMGLLNRMMDILERISPEESVYDLKLAIIENCLYGSDIQSIAAQITKLRFFISLICNCEKDASKPNFGIPTLPNLETKFVTANSLIGIKDKGKEVQGNLFIDSQISDLKKTLHDVRHKHFRSKTASEKIRLRKEDEAIRTELADILSQGFQTGTNADQLISWNPYDQNAVSPFFDPEWMFGVKDGFDIVIGNPPYIQLQNDGGKLGKMYQPCGYKTFASTGDIYCLFYERGHQLLKQGGHLCYITSNKWMRAGYGEKTREFFATQTNPMLLID